MSLPRPPTRMGGRRAKKEEVSSQDHDNPNLASMFQIGDQAIARKRTDNLFKQLDERQLTDEEQNIIQQRVDLQRKLFQEFEKRECQRKIQELQDVCPDLTTDMAEQALSQCNWKEEEAAVRFTSDPLFRRRILASAPLPMLNTTKASTSAPTAPRQPRTGPSFPRPRLVDAAALQQGHVFVGAFRGRLGPAQMAQQAQRLIDMGLINCRSKGGQTHTRGASGAAPTTGAGGVESSDSNPAQAQPSAPLPSSPGSSATISDVEEYDDDQGAESSPSPQMSADALQQQLVQAQPGLAAPVLHMSTALHPTQLAGTAAASATADVAQSPMAESSQGGVGGRAGGPQDDEQVPDVETNDGEDEEFEWGPTGIVYSQHDGQEVVRVCLEDAQLAALVKKAVHEAEAAPLEAAEGLADHDQVSHHVLCPLGPEATGTQEPPLAAPSISAAGQAIPSADGVDSGMTATVLAVQGVGCNVAQGLGAGMLHLPEGGLPCMDAVQGGDVSVWAGARGRRSNKRRRRESFPEAGMDGTGDTHIGVEMQQDETMMQQGVMMQGQMSQGGTITGFPMPSDILPLLAGLPLPDAAAVSLPNSFQTAATTVSVASPAQGEGRSIQDATDSETQTDTDTSPAPAPTRAARGRGRRRGGAVVGAPAPGPMTSVVPIPVPDATGILAASLSLPEFSTRRSGTTRATVAISARGHTNRGRVKQKGAKRADLLSVGTLRPQDGWYNAGYIFPEGFRSRTIFRSSVELAAVCVHECAIVGEGGQYWPLPTFQVTAMDRPNEPLVAKSCTGCWSQVLKRINREIETRRAAGEDLPPAPKTAIAGPEYFGFNQPEVVAAVEALDALHLCVEYWVGKEDRHAMIQGVFPATATTSLPSISTGGRGGGTGRGRGGRRGGGSAGSSAAPDVDDLDSDLYVGNRWAGIDRAQRYRRRCAGGDGGGGSCGSAPVDPEHPLPGFIDPITLEVVVNPAISPQGHVMGMATWRAVLAEHKRCPFTKAPLSSDQLVLLTKNNIERYKHRIIHQ